MSAKFEEKDQPLMHLFGVRVKVIMLTFIDRAVLNPTACISPIIKGPLSRIDYLVHGSNFKGIDFQFLIPSAHELKHSANGRVDGVVVSSGEVFMNNRAPIP